MNTPKMPKNPDPATYAEVLGLLSGMARKGDVRAAIALAGHLRKEQSDDAGEEQSAIDELASKRSAKAS